MGAGAFFAYCHFRFGVWDLYQKCQEVGWAVRPNYLVPFSWRTYDLPPAVRLLDLTHGAQPYFWGRLCMTVTVILLAVLLWNERPWSDRLLTGVRQRAGWYLAAALIFYVSVSAMVGRNFDSMVRHHLAVHVLLVTAIIHLISVDPRHTFAKAPWWVLPALGSFAAQCYFAWRFTHGEWVA
jgi:hypothetical protein